MVLAAFAVGWLALPGLLLLPTGVLLWKAGRWPRRRGTDPHCLKCDYNLTGLASGVCPECGRPFGPDAIAHGERSQRSGLIVASRFVLLTAALCLGLPVADALSRVDWYHYKSAKSVIADLNSPDNALVQKAYEEILHRLAARTLADEDEDAFLRTFVRVQLRVRPRVPVGSSVSYELAVSTPIPCKDIAVKVLQIEGTVDGRPCDWFQGPLGDGYSLLRFTRPDHMPITERRLYTGDQILSGGRHMVRCRAQLQFDYTSSWRWTNVAPNNRVGENMPDPHQQWFDLEAICEVVGSAGSCVTILKDPQIKQLLTGSLQVPVLVHRGNPTVSVWAPVRISMPLPANIALDVFARIGQQEYYLHSMVGAKGDWLLDTESLDRGTWSTRRAAIRSIVEVGKADVILRTSPEAALRTPDLMEIQECEVVLPDVPFQSEEEYYDRRPRNAY